MSIPTFFSVFMSKVSFTICIVTHSTGYVLYESFVVNKIQMVVFLLHLSNSKKVFTLALDDYILSP